MKQKKNTVTFVPREVAETYMPKRDTHLISIIHPEQARPFHHDCWGGITTLMFDDVTAQSGNLVLFNEEHAKKIHEVIAKDHRHIVVHCEAGMSRSAAVAKWIGDNSKYTMYLDFDGIGTDRHYNKFVYDVLDASVGKNLEAYYRELEQQAFLNPE